LPTQDKTKASKARQFFYIFINLADRFLRF
jgi:hypothetical protein